MVEHILDKDGIQVQVLEEPFFFIITSVQYKFLHCKFYSNLYTLRELAEWFIAVNLKFTNL